MSTYTCKYTYMDVRGPDEIDQKARGCGRTSPGTASRFASTARFSPQIVSLASHEINNDLP